MPLVFCKARSVPFVFCKARSVPFVFCKARSVPFAMKDKLMEELVRLEREGRIRSVNYSDWAVPTVPVTKSSGQVGICGDYKVTINKVANKVDRYP